MNRVVAALFRVFRSSIVSLLEPALHELLAPIRAQIDGVAAPDGTLSAIERELTEPERATAAQVVDIIEVRILAEVRARLGA